MSTVAPLKPRSFQSGSLVTAGRPTRENGNILSDFPSSAKRVSRDTLRFNVFNSNRHIPAVWLERVQTVQVMAEISIRLNEHSCTPQAEEFPIRIPRYGRSAYSGMRKHSLRFPE